MDQEISGLHVTNIRQEKSTEPDGKGGLQDVWTIYFTTPSGTDTFVRVPALQYHKDAVAQYIADELHHVESVHGLEGVPLTAPPAYEDATPGP
jgi:hypothetical protein